MQQLLDEQMRTKLSHQEAAIKESHPQQPTATQTLPSTSTTFERKRNKLFALFRSVYS